MSEVKAADIKIALAKKHKDEFFLTEVKNGPTGTGTLIFDAVAIYKSWAHPKFVGYEIKVSRSDLLRDNKYHLYIPYFHEFYFVVPSGLVERHEIEDNVGLIWFNPSTGNLITKKKAVYRNIEPDPYMLLYIIFTRLENDRIPFYSDKAEYWKAWLNNKMDNKALSWKVRNELLNRLVKLEEELDRYKFKGDLQKYDEIIEVMQKYGISTWDAAQNLDKALSKAYPPDLDTAFRRLDYAIELFNDIRSRVVSAGEDQNVYEG